MRIGSRGLMIKKLTILIAMLMATSAWAVDVRNDPLKELFKIPEEVLLICSGDFKQKTKDTTQEDITFYLERGHEAGWIKGSHSLIRNEDNYPYNRYRS